MDFQIPGVRHGFAQVFKGPLGSFTHKQRLDVRVSRQLRSRGSPVGNLLAISNRNFVARLQHILVHINPDITVCILIGPILTNVNIVVAGDSARFILANRYEAALPEAPPSRRRQDACPFHGAVLARNAAAVGR